METIPSIVLEFSILKMALYTIQTLRVLSELLYVQNQIAIIREYPHLIHIQAAMLIFQHFLMVYISKGKEHELYFRRRPVVDRVRSNVDGLKRIGYLI